MDNDDLLRADLDILSAADFDDAVVAARQVSFRGARHESDGEGYFSDPEDMSLAAVVGRLALRAFVALRSAGLVPMDLTGDEPARLGVGAMFPDDDHLQAYALAVLKGNFRHIPSEWRPVNPAGAQWGVARRRRPDAAVR